MRRSPYRKFRWWLEDNYVVAVAFAFVVAIVLVVHPKIPVELPDILGGHLVYDERPYIVDWCIGNAMGHDEWAKAAVLDLDMTVYPPDGATTIYPANIPLTPDLDPMSGYYAVGFEGTLQSNIWFDNNTRRFYNRFISSPTRASECMVYTPGNAARGGELVVQERIAAAALQKAANQSAA